MFSYCWADNEKDYTKSWFYSDNECESENRQRTARIRVGYVINNKNMGNNLKL